MNAIIIALSVPALICGGMIYLVFWWTPRQVEKIESERLLNIRRDMVSEQWEDFTSTIDTKWHHQQDLRDGREAAAFKAEQDKYPAIKRRKNATPSRNYSNPYSGRDTDDSGDSFLAAAVTFSAVSSDSCDRSYPSSSDSSCSSDSSSCGDD